MDGIAGIKYLAELKPKHTIAIIKAHFSFYHHLPEMLNKRNGKEQEVYYYDTDSIIWSYFVLGKKKYKDL